MLAELVTGTNHCCAGLMIEGSRRQHGSHARRLPPDHDLWPSKRPLTPRSRRGVWSPPQLAVLPLNGRYLVYPSL